MELETAFFADAKRLLMALLLATVRIQAALVVIPLFSKQVVPGMIRTALGVCLAVVLVPPIDAAMAAEPPAAVPFFLIVVKEALLGFLLGYAVAVLFWAVEAVGFFIDNQRGASIASTLNPLTGNDTSPLGIMFNQAFVVYFLVAGGFLLFMTTIYESHRLWPVLSFFPTLPEQGAMVFGGFFAGLIRLGLLLSAPAILAMLLAEVGLALVSRFAPQLQVFFLAMPVKSGLAFFVLVIYLPTLFTYVHSEIGRLPELLGAVSGAVK
ncbi:type III secretion system export apparatus subunit SctT [Pseudothauera rhizosphaerae]|uniref:EscT/YscT/HrcT family type III secretion system export apparatus protein n=1 Tax=Pseudothauera rhizosphaerae TaxID=2565932 RepID=A0A4S4ADT5_9RHOO|nr:type III secretion system export apparatus subunit SctT [Pseudothauera rhizosphaerae]THF57262.1 EscT/YscT/HrcT family type III secretion system export apparatus protein [Pseudothauera rhizosphaerae]